MYNDAYAGLKNPALYVNHLSAFNFRNYGQLELELGSSKRYNVIISPNGMGKSNLLEMFYYLSHVRTFRGANDKELIKRGEKNFVLAADYSSNGPENSIKIKYSMSKEIFFNDKKIGAHSQILGKLLTVLFSSDDLFIISGSPSIRRRFFDIFISILDPEYLDELRRYKLLLKQKNMLLKEGNEELLFTFDCQLAERIFNLQRKRAEIIEQIDTCYKEKYLEIGGFKEKVKIVYQPSIKSKDLTKESILQALEQNRKRDIETTYSLLGSHKDNYLFLINGIPFAKFASFGQTRLASLVLKVIQAKFYEKQFRVKPILLIDDVILELDPAKQKRFIESISADNQMFFTVTDDKYLDLFRTDEYINIIRVNNGQII